jgi:hypothetical protein
VRAGAGLALRLDLGAQVEGITQQAFFAGLQVENARIAGVGAVLVDGDRPLRQRLAGGVLEAQAQEGIAGVDGGVVDADLVAFEVLIEDGQHRRLLPRQGDLLVEDVLVTPIIAAA